MADIVFLNALRDEDYVKHLKEQASAAGLSVWSISDTRGGTNHAQVLQDNINAAKVIVPLGDTDFISGKTSGGKDFVDIVREAATRPLNPKPIRVLNLRPCMIEALRTPNSIIYPDAAHPITSIRDRAAQEAAMNQFIRNIAAEAPGLQAGPPVPSENIAPRNPYGNLPIPPQLPRFNVSDASPLQSPTASQYSPSSQPPITPQRFNVSHETVTPQSAAPVPAAGPVGVHVLTLRGDSVDSENVDAFRVHSIQSIRSGKMAFSSSNSPGMGTVEKEKEAIDKAKVVMIAVSPKYVASDEFVELVAYAKAAGKKVVPLISQPTNLVGTPIETLLHLPRDGKALSEMSQAQKDSAFAGKGNKPGIVAEIKATAGIQENSGPSRYR